MSRKKVKVHLTDNSVAEGTFVCIDGNLNIVLE